MKVAKTNGPDIQAYLSTDHSAASYGRPVLVLGDSVALGPEDVLSEGFELTSLTAGEAERLAMSGYLSAFAGSTQSPARIKFMLEALAFDVKINRGEKEPWSAVATRCSKLVCGLVMAGLVERLAELQGGS